VLVRRDLHLEHELAVLDGSDAMTNLVPPSHPIPSAAPTAPGSASATTMSPTTPPSHPLPEHSTDGPWLGLDDNYPDDNYPRSALTNHHLVQHLVHDNHYPIPGAAPTAPGPTAPPTAHPIHQGGIP